LPPGTIPIVPYPLGPHTAPEERDRDLGVALAALGGGAGAADPMSRAMVADIAEERLRTAVARWPADLRARLALVQVCQARGDWEGAFDAASAASAQAPASVEAQAALAAAAAAVGQTDTAVAAATELIRLSPSGVDPLLLRAGIFMREGDWAKADADCRAALAVQPLHPRAHLYLGICRHWLGDPAGGRREADTAAALATKPAQRTAFVEMYRAQTK
jgi:Flp pilus assembly protein TadD